jgi:hypothetical protein
MIAQDWELLMGEAFQTVPKLRRSGVGLALLYGVVAMISGSKDDFRSGIKQPRRCVQATSCLSLTLRFSTGTYRRPSKLSIIYDLSNNEKKAEGTLASKFRGCRFEAIARAKTVSPVTPTETTSSMKNDTGVASCFFLS